MHHREEDRRHTRNQQDEGNKAMDLGTTITSNDSSGALETSELMMTNELTRCNHVTRNFAAIGKDKLDTFLLQQHTKVAVVVGF